MYDKLTIKIIDDLTTIGEVSPNNKRLLKKYSIDINDLTSSFGTNLIGECYTAYSVSSLISCGIRCEDYTGRIGVWCELEILKFLIEQDMDFNPCLKFLTVRLSECKDKQVSERLNQRYNTILELRSQRKNGLMKQIYKCVDKDLSFVILSYF